MTDENIVMHDEEIKVTLVAPTGEKREYDTYSEFIKDCRFFWSSEMESDYETSSEYHFNMIANMLLEFCESEMSIHTKRNGLKVILTYKED